MNWGPSPERPDMAYSVEDETYIALYAVWAATRPTTRRNVGLGDRAACARWSTLASGIQLADENLGRRPARFVSRREPARGSTRSAREYDPDGLFHPWMGRPEP